jgi:hypothetical protein
LENLLESEFNAYYDNSPENQMESGPSTNGEAHLRWGCYVNYPDTDLNNYGGLGKALSLYYGGNLPRLIRAKREWDQLNYFQNSQSIPVS